MFVTYDPMKRSRVVQPDVLPSTRTRLQRYADRLDGVLDSDPAFAMIGCWNLEGKNWSEQPDWRP